MGFYVNTTDFIGKYAISQGVYSNLDINDYISKYELTYLVELLGVELYNLYYADANAQLDKIPLTPIYSFIFNPFNYQDNYTLMLSKGFKEMLIGFIYFEYMRDSIATATTTSMQSQKNENSQKNILPIYTRYNEAIITYRAIQNYIITNKQDYLTFKGVNKEFAYWL